VITRVLAGLIGLAVLVPSLLFGGVVAVDLLVGLVLILCLDEYANMAFPDDRWPSTAWLVLTGGGVFAGAVYLDPRWLGLVALAATMATLMWVVFRPGPELARAADRTGRYLVGALWVGGFFAALPMLRRLDHGLVWVFMVLAIAWLGDTGGYFAGRALGRHKLYPLVSPKKTWEGLAGGIALTVAGVFVIRAVALPELSVVEAVLLGVVLGCVATVGDLSESMLKRSYDVKDSGWLMPGHGGLLDRVDSVLFVGPLLYAFAVLVKGA